MPELTEEIVVERTPMRDLARRLIQLLHDARIEAWMAARSGTEVVREGDLVASAAWDVRVSEPLADRARRVIAQARRAKRMAG
jgi:hypothetical protein